MSVLRTNGPLVENVFICLPAYQISFFYFVSYHFQDYFNLCETGQSVGRLKKN